MYHTRRCTALIFTLVALVALITFPALLVGATTTFTDPQNRFSVDIPDGWQPDRTQPIPALPLSSSRPIPMVPLT